MFYICPKEGFAVVFIHRLDVVNVSKCESVELCKPLKKMFFFNNPDAEAQWSSVKAAHALSLSYNSIPPAWNSFLASALGLL